MAEKIWMVGGTSGEYSDRTEWVVDAWRSEAEAKARVEELKRRYLELGGDSMYRIEDWDERQKTYDKMRETDPAFQADYTGTEWYVCELELKP